MLGQTIGQDAGRGNAVGAEMAVIAAQLAPRHQDAAIFEITEHDGPDDAFGSFTFFVDIGDR